MDIAIISEHASPVGVIGGIDAGGQNIYVAQLAKNLSLMGHKVEVFTRKEDESAPVIQEMKEGYRLINVPAGPAKKIPKEEILPLMEEFSDFMLDYISSRERKFDVIHSNFFMSGMVASEIKKVTGIPYVITFHALGRVRKIHQGDKDSFPVEREKIEERIVHDADRIIAECPQDYDDLVNLYHASEEKLEIIPCGFDDEEMYPVEREVARSILGLPQEEKVILHLGRMVPRKGADNVIHGFSRYLKHTKDRARLLIVGGESATPDPIKTPELGRLMNIAHEAGVGSGVHFLGSRSREVLRIYYSAADVFITTPWYEPFGITPVESMACGTPVIGSNVGGIKYTVIDGETGFLVPPNDPESLRDKLSLLLNDSALMHKMRSNSKARAREHFSWENIVQKIAETISEVVMDSNKRSLLNIKGGQYANL